MNPRYPEVAARASRRCEYCHAPQLASHVIFEVEHVEPVSAGGDDEPENLALACRACNAFKGVKQQAQDPDTQALVPVFNPCQQVWEEHFTVNGQTLEIIGLTPTGRAAVVALHLNNSLQLSSRLFWNAVGLFP
jgi:hypothetical protein